MTIPRMTSSLTPPSILKGKPSTFRRNNNTRFVLVGMVIITTLLCMFIRVVTTQASSFISSSLEMNNNDAHVVELKFMRTTIGLTQQNTSSSIDWQSVDPLFGSPCNSTAQCGKHLLCINSTCQSCDLARNGELCLDEPYVVCRVQNQSVKLINSSHFVNIDLVCVDQRIYFQLRFGILWDRFSHHLEELLQLLQVLEEEEFSIYIKEFLWQIILFIFHTSVPVLFLIGRYPASVAIALSTIIIFGASASVYATLAFKRHPLEKQRPLIDYQIAVIVEPIILAGSIVGVFLNVWFPNWSLTVMLLLVLLIVSYRSIKKGRQMWKKENEERLQKQQQQQLELARGDNTEELVETHPQMVEISRSINAEESFELEEEEPRQNLSLEESEHHEHHDEDETKLVVDEISLEDALETKSYSPTLEKIKKSELIVFPVISWCLLLVSWTIVFISSFLKGGKSFPSVLGIEKCSVEYWLIVAASFPLLLLMSGIAGIILRYMHHKKEQHGYNYLDGDVRWTTRNVTLIPLVFFTAGLAASLLGIGGGLVVGPLLLEMGVNPLVSVATSSFTVLLTGSSTAIQFLIMGVISWDYFCWYFVCGILSGIAGQIVVALLMKRFNRPSLIVFIIAIFIAISSILTGAMGIKSLVDNLMQGGYFGFNNIC
ncbi:hypothetical protein C9374_001180 [Naegleria lovaniensis]|uniref:Sulfite exporter TauE/SafE family protein n=1 Tax=Naegleria lovaniensis TaxID=51637 RepID=A0AA88GSJ3_NAELO|nr:uncharacterized protein C9374_001180 [Naegleria lovaniensis]KAG2387586.1 hypothetical protein C9374_001180 [Naegleria lovaniensis]